jgi:hypothetical protein
MHQRHFVILAGRLRGGFRRCVKTPGGGRKIIQKGIDTYLSDGAGQVKTSRDILCKRIFYFTV